MTNAIQTAHAASLRARAIPDYAAEAAGIQSASAYEVAATLGIQKAQSGGMLLSYLDRHGNPVTGADGLDLVRVRMDAGAPKYQSRAGSGYSMYLPPLVRAQAAAATAHGAEAKLEAPILVITEGELKALSVEHNLGIPAVGLPGVNMYWSPERDKTEPATDATPLHPELVAVLKLAHGVVVIADSDAAEKPQVRAAMRLLKEAISKQHNVICAYFEVPGAKKGPGRPKLKKDALGADAGDQQVAPQAGIDDWIASAGVSGLDHIIATIKKALSAEQARVSALETGGGIPLGFTLNDTTGAGTYEVFSVLKSGIISVASRDITNQSTLMHVFGEDYLCAMYPKLDKEGRPSGFDATRAGGAMQKACEQVGFWNPERKVQTGVWPIEGDDTAVVVNSSSGLWVTDGRPAQRVEPGNQGSVYVGARDLGITPSTTQCTAGEAECVLDALKTFTWSDPRDAGMAMGWLAAAFYCGGLQQRPMLYVSGARGSGKSQLLNFFRNTLGQFALPKMEGTSLTEAGLRRSLGSSSLVTLIDEAEASDKPERLQEVLSYVRSAYEGGVTSKGSQTGAGVDRYVVRSMVAMGAINPPAMNDAEQSRFIRLHLTKRRGDAESNDLVTTPSLARDIGQMLGARMLHSFGRFSRALAVVRPLLGSASMRYQDTIGTVVAAGFVALHDDEPSKENMRAYLKTLDVETQHGRIVETRSDRTALEWLMDRVMQVDVAGRNSRLAVREIVIQAHSEMGSRIKPNIDALGRMGLRLAKDEFGEPTLLVDPRRGELEEVFRGSQWSERDLKDAFVQDTRCGRKMLESPVQIGGKKVRVLEVLLGDLVSFDEDIEPRRKGGSATSDGINAAYAH